jgi:hypothetical protein
MQEVTAIVATATTGMARMIRGDISNTPNDRIPHARSGS